MANTIRIKRRSAGGNAGAPSGLANAELAYNEADNVLYYGFGTGGAGGTATQVIPIAGSGAYLTKNNNLSDLNNLQTSRNNLAGGTTTSGSFMRGNGTNVLMGSILASDVPTLNQNTTGSAGTVTSGVYTSRTLTAGSGIAGGGDLSADRTFNIGQGDGITVSADSIAVDSTVVRTTGNQSISGNKTFINNIISSGSILSFGALGNFNENNNGIFTSFNATGSDTIRLYMDNYGSGFRQLTLTTAGQLSADRNIYFPDKNGTVTLLTDITTTNITGILAVNKGGTGATTLTANNILVGNGTSAISAPYTVETTLTGGVSAIPRADAVKTYVDSAITSGFSTNDAMVFKGTLGSGGTVTALPTGTVSAGWSYRVITTGTYAGVVSEIGDLIIAVADSGGNVNSTWTVVQTNLDGAVVGPASATDNALAVFNGATGKLIKNSSFIPTTVGSGLINLTNPGAIRFVRINADNTVSSLSDTDFRTAIGAGTSSTVGTVTSVGGTGSTAGLTLTGTVTTAGSLTLGGTLSTPVSTINDSTTVGQNLVKLANPSAIRFVRINADNSVTALSDSDFRTAIGAGTSSTVGTVTSVAALTLATSGTDLSSSVANGTTTPTITLNVPTASASVRGALSSTDWSTFNGKAAANQTMFIGTTSVAINRSSAALVLTGITSIDGNAATVTNGVYTTGDQTIAGVKTFNTFDGDGGLRVGDATMLSFLELVSQTDTGGVLNVTRLIAKPPSSGTYDIVLPNGSGVLARLEDITTTNITGVLGATKGGTGQSLYAIGDLLYANTTTGLAKLANVATGNVLLAGGVSTASSWGKVGLTTHVSGTLPVANGGTNQTSYTNGQLLIGNDTGNTLTKATLTQGTNVTITNGNGTITIASTDTNTATAADDILDGSNTGTQITYAPYATNQAASATPRFYNTSDNPSGSGRLNVSAYLYATNLYDNGSRVVTASTICTDAANCTWDGGTF